MSKQSKEWLVSFDTDRVKNYVFATNSLKEIRGASALLVVQDDERKKLLAKYGELIYSAGGGGAVLVESEEKAQDAIQEIEREFRRATVTASITAVSLPPDQRPQSEWFGKHMDAASRALQKKKSFKGELSLLPVEPYMRLCDSCGYRPAEKRFLLDASGDLLCMSCWQKRDKGMEIRDQKSKEGFFKKFNEFVSGTQYKEKWEGVVLSEDLNQLGDLDGSGYIGFITADGNHMGMMLSLLEREENYRDFSGQLANLMQHIVFDTLAKETKPVNRDGMLILPFEIVLIGGDDLMMFTTASQAPSLAVKIVEQFEEKTTEILKKTGVLENRFYERLKKGFEPDPPPIAPDEPFITHQKLTMAAGVVLCHSNFPVPALVEIAETLQKNAKKKCAEKCIRYAQGAIDFQVITSGATDLDLARAAVPHNRPYTRSDIKMLLNYALDFYEDGFPRTQLQMLYDACHQQSQAHGTLAALSAIARLRKRTHRQLLQKFFREFCPKGESFFHWPWRVVEKNEAGQKRLKTALVDLVDLYDFVKKENQHGQSHP